MTEVIGDKSAVTLNGLLADLHHKMQKGAITIAHLKRFLNKQNPFALPDHLLVDGGNPRFQSIRKADYCDDISRVITIELLPISNLLIREVEYDFLELNHDSTVQEILEAFEKSDLRRPERDEAEKFFDHVSETKDELTKQPIIALCGSTCVLLNETHIVYEELSGRGRSLGLCGLDNRSVQKDRILGVRK